MERKTCIRCERPIDLFATLCPYCNWDQAVLPPPRPAVEPAPPAAAYVAERDEHNRRMVMLAGGFAVLLVLAFAVGSLVHGFDVDSTVKTSTDKDKRPTPPIGATVTPQPKGANVDLVPVTQPVSPAEAPITSAPAATASSGTATAERSDATALPSDQYARAAARARAERQSALTDPRSIIASPYETPQRPRRVAAAAPPPAPGEPMASSAPPPGELAPPTHVARTLPVPESQPLPDIRVPRDATARLNLTIGPDGRVHDVEVIESIPGETSKLIGAVQNWRFRPATENGLPVASHFSVDISFRANE